MELPVYSLHPTVLADKEIDTYGAMLSVTFIMATSDLHHTRLTVGINTMLNENQAL